MDDSDIRALRQQCRQCERRWKKDRLQVSYEMLRDSLHTFQKTAKAAHLSEIVAKNSHCSRTLFSTIDSVKSPNADITRAFYFIMCKFPQVFCR